MVQTSPPGAPVSVTAKFGPVFRNILDAMAPAVRTLIDRGNAVIFDHVLHDRAMYDSYRNASAGLDFFTVAVTCPLDVLEQRERARGDRVLGRARGLADIVHTFCGYDVMVHTGLMQTEACVGKVLGVLAGSRPAN
jgi:chloramphenicol 3-O phosphotransferase